MYGYRKKKKKRVVSNVCDEVGKMGSFTHDLVASVEPKCRNP